ncbi:unnamed protein product [Porites evermanni]|uniref:C2H2-type domain-containing protein n=1 Tax=Porites evermanni TaxID=104178 RepID=A0ABN8T3W9_9CNID|nr:unnamed protein product [Porites evermanni]
MLDTLRDGKYQAVSCSLGTYTNSSLDTLLNIHSLRDISQQVKQEKTWLTKTPPLPNHQCALPGFLDVYQKLLFGNADDKVVINTGILTSDLANLTSNRWLNIAMINGFIDLLNAHHHNTMTAVFMLNDLLMLKDVDLQRHARSVMRGKQIKAIVFIINVAGGIKKTDVATPNKPGRHWSLLYIDAVENKWFYCDTLAWPPPTNINTTVNAILNVLAMEFPVFRKPAQGRFIAHKPEGNHRGSHQCTNGCFKNVPLQSCGSVCGVIVVKGAHSLDMFQRYRSATAWNPGHKPRITTRNRSEIYWDSPETIASDRPETNTSDGPETPTCDGTETMTDQEPPAVTEQKPPTETKQKSPPDTDKKPPTDTNQKPTHVTDQKPPPMTGKKSLPVTDQKPPVRTDQTLPRKATKSSREKKRKQALETDLKRETAKRSRQAIGLSVAKSLGKKPTPKTLKKEKQNQGQKIQEKRQEPAGQREGNKEEEIDRIGQETKLHRCPECDYICPKVSNMKRHMKRKHNLNSNNVTSQKGKCLCNECDRQFYRIKDLREHLSSSHGFIFKTDAIHLQNVKEFESWKAEVEENEGCSFVKVTGSKKHLSTGQKVEYFQCNRGGSYRPRRSGKRRQKSQGSCKIEKNCTSSMLLKYEDDGTITVDVCYTHYGHEIELQHVWLSKTKRQELAAKMQQGVPRDRILNDIREGVTEDQFLREHLVEKKDLFNIQRAFGLKDYQRHQNDLDSVLA